MTQKFSQSHFRIQTQSQRGSEGPRPRRLTKDLRVNRHRDVPWENTSHSSLDIRSLLRDFIYVHRMILLQ